MTQQISASKSNVNPDSKSMVIFVAHADDTEFFAGGTIAKRVAEGWSVTEVIATNNERGSFELDRETLIENSRNEAWEAARILGKQDVIFLEYPDGFLGDTPINELREKFMRIIRELKPSAIMTWDAFAPYETHPDHRHVAMAATEAANFSHFPLFHPEHADAGYGPHFVSEKYFFAKSPAGRQTVINIEDFIDRKIDALCAHESQMKLTVDDQLVSLQSMRTSYPLLEQLDRDNYRPVIDAMIKRWAAKVGKKQGYAYAETFRIERAGGLPAEVEQEQDND